MCCLEYFLWYFCHMEYVHDIISESAYLQIPER